MNRHIVVTLATGALLSVSGCGKPTPPPTNPPTPAPDDRPPTNPPRIEEAPLPTWDEVESGHPEHATNPPVPHLIVTPEGDCYKKWVGGMIAQGAEAKRVEACAEDCGTQVQCPPEAAELLEAHRSGTTLQPK